MLSSAARAQVWTEEAVLERALARIPLDDLESARIRADRGRAQTESTWPAIELSYTREQTFGSGSTGEDYLGATIPLDLANRRGLRGEAWEHRALAESGAIDRAGRDRVAEIRALFHRVLAARAQLDALGAWLERIEAMLESVRQREAAGDAARYERLRLERERAVVITRTSAEEGMLAGAESALASWLGEELEGALEGALVPPPPPPLADALARLEDLPELAARAREIEAAHLEAESAARAWVPDIGLILGAKLVEVQGGTRSDGFYGGIVLRLPIFDFGSGARASAEAEADAARIELDLERRDAERAVRAAHAEASRLAAAAAELSDETTTRSVDLIAIVEASYAGGEASLLEVLDAHRGAAEDQVAVVELGLAAWNARIELDRASGIGVGR